MNDIKKVFEKEAEGLYPYSINESLDVMQMVNVFQAERRTAYVAACMRMFPLMEQCFKAGEDHGYDLARSSDWGEDTTTPTKSEFINNLFKE
jgi:hypothetical protein